MAKVTKSKSPMQEILGAYLDKEFGNYIEYSSHLAGEDVLKSSLEKMADDIHRATFLAGHRSVPGSGKVIHQTADMQSPLRNRATIGALVHAAFEATPAQFVAFCGYRLEEARGELHREKMEGKHYQLRCGKLIDIILNSRTIRKARKAYRDMEDL